MYFRVLIAACLALLTGCVQMSSRYVSGSDYDKALILYDSGLLFEARQKAYGIPRNDISYKAASKLIMDINAVFLQVSRRHMEIGEDFEKAGIYQQAIAEYTLSLKYNPSNLLVSNKITTLTEALRDGRRLEADKEKPSHAPVPAKKKAIKIEEDPEVIANAHYIKGKIYYESKAYARAIDEFNSVLRNVPAYMDTKDLLDKSKKERDKAVDRHIKNGIGYFQAEEMDLAIKEWDTVLELDPGNKKAADYKYRAEVIMDRLKKIREKKAEIERPL